MFMRLAKTQQPATDQASLADVGEHDVRGWGAAVTARTVLAGAPALRSCPERYSSTKKKTIDRLTSRNADGIDRSGPAGWGGAGRSDAL